MQKGDEEKVKPCMIHNTYNDFLQLDIQTSLDSEGIHVGNMSKFDIFHSHHLHYSRHPHHCHPHHRHPHSHHPHHRYHQAVAHWRWWSWQFPRSLYSDSQHRYRLLEATRLWWYSSWWWWWSNHLSTVMMMMMNTILSWHSFLWTSSSSPVQLWLGGFTTLQRQMVQERPGVFQVRKRQYDCFFCICLDGELQIMPWIIKHPACGSFATHAAIYVYLIIVFVIVMSICNLHLYLQFPLVNFDCIPICIPICIYFCK